MYFWNLLPEEFQRNSTLKLTKGFHVTSSEHTWHVPKNVSWSLWTLRMNLFEIPPAKDFKNTWNHLSIHVTVDIYHNKPLQGMAPTGWLLSACLLDCFLAFFTASLLAWLLPCLPACLPACLLACLLACWLACLPAYLLACCLHTFLLPCSLLSSLLALS